MQKAKDLSEITKLNMAVSESETKINEIYSEIGYKVYCAYRENPLEEVKEEIGQIREAGRGYGSMQTTDPGNQCNEQLPALRCKNQTGNDVLQQLWNETAE